ncbi:MAG: lysylphosphatidylglycerol synthase transmembrane domain-containing protein [Candidatus Daviesbacteria bacterium]|nr:lysylphosphatidylglycerol synthase transmembrane domain-containing protein [Candidatus Daviesbacteria bacterium]
MIKVLFNTALGIVLIFIWSRFVNIGEIFSAISKVNLFFLVPILFFMLLSPVLRAVRLKVFLAEVTKIKLLDLIYLNGAAMMLNFFIPIRAGEVLKGIYLNTNYNLPLGKSVIWIFIDRFVDFLAVLFLASVLFFVVPTALNIMFITVIIIILFIVLSLTYLVVFQSTFARKMFSFLRYFLVVNHIKIYFDSFSNFILEAFAILNRHPKDLILMMGITFLAYAVDAAVWYFTFIALGANQAYLKMYLGQLLSALTYLVPAAPGYVGSAEASGLLILSGVFGIEANLASAMTVLFHILSAIFVLIFGIVSIYFLKINVGTLLKKVLKR